MHVSCDEHYEHEWTAHCLWSVLDRIERACLVSCGNRPTEFDGCDDNRRGYDSKRVAFVLLMTFVHV